MRSSYHVLLKMLSIATHLLAIVIVLVVIATTFYHYEYNVDDKDPKRTTTREDAVKAMSKLCFMAAILSFGLLGFAIDSFPLSFVYATMVNVLVGYTIGLSFPNMWYKTAAIVFELTLVTLAYQFAFVTREVATSSSYEPNKQNLTKPERVTIKFNNNQSDMAKTQV
ncbi:hypothetical protein HDE_04405 [Halotydeus destructor]|nr:hypothetical protein HDE_04405 [Halotydeus destructor]